MLKNAIVRTPCPEMVNGIKNSEEEKPHYTKALQQHRDYIEVLRELGLSVTILEADSRFPDSVFVEDVAVCTPHRAVITRPGALSRQDETEGMEKTLSAFFEKIEEIKEPGTLEGGDVLSADSRFYIGISKRTNQAGADQFAGILNQDGVTVSSVPVKTMLHLKTGTSYLGKNTLLVSQEFKDHPAFQNFNKIVTEPKEAPATNTLLINGTVLVPAGYPVTKSRIEQAGFSTIVVDISEFEKLNGGLSCLSLRF